MRVPLRVPCHDPQAFDVALRSGTDALVLDLGDAASPDVREEQRRGARALLLRHRSRPETNGSAWPILALRVAALSSGLVDADLDGVMGGAPDAIVLSGAVGAVDIQHLAAKLAVREAEYGLAAGYTRIVASAADTGRGVLALWTLAGASPRLIALGWDPEALALDLGVADARAAPCRVARGLVVAAAVAAGVPALDLSVRDAGEGLGRVCARARQDGFAGKLALDPAQVPVIGVGFRSAPA